MTKEMIISSNGHETMVAILEDDLVAEIFVERERQRGVVGNVYKGRVSKVLPGMQSSFIDLGLERDGFLYVADVIDTLGRVRQARGRRRRRGRRQRQRMARSGRPGARSPGSSAAEDRRPAQGRPGDPRPGRQGAARHQGRAPHLARDDARPLPGVHADGRSHRRVAQDRVARGARRLRGIVREFREAHGFTGGVIIRTAAAGRPKEDIVSDLDAFHKIWTEMRQRNESSRAPAVALPGAEPRRAAAARSADRGLPGDPHRQRAGVPARARAGRAHHAEPRAEGEALLEAVSRSSTSTACRPRSTRR